MKDILVLFRPRLFSLKFRKKGNRVPGKNLKIPVLILSGLIFWFGIYFVSLRVLTYFIRTEELGTILSYKLLSMIFATIFFLLLFSSILTALSRLYLSRDLLLVHAMPLESHTLFTARWIESTADSSWMVILYTLPVLVAYGVMFRSGVFFYAVIFLCLMFISIIASALSSLLVMLAVILVPASRIRTLFVFAGLFVFIALYIAFRMLRPERLVDPEAFSATLFYLKALQTPSSPWLPSTWACDAVTAALTGSIRSSLFHLGLCLSFTGIMVCTLLFASEKIYFMGVSKARISAARLLKKRKLNFRFLTWLPGQANTLAVKEIKTFFRDQTQWSQLFLIGALMGIYIYNFKVLPLENSPIKTLYLQNLLSFLNMGLALFVLTAVTGRFAFPAVSTEGEAIWLIRSAPIRIKQFLWIKYLVYFVPLFILTLVLIVGTNMMLQVVPFMMVLSLANLVFMVPGIVSLGIGLGAGYPDFKSENPAQTVTSYGGLMFMLSSAIFIGSIIILEAGPVYTIIKSQIRGTPLSPSDLIWITLAFSLAAVLSILVFVMPMRFGEKKLSAQLFLSD